jgi:hypothetical protein
MHAAKITTLSNTRVFVARSFRSSPVKQSGDASSVFALRILESKSDKTFQSIEVQTFAAANLARK